MCLSVEKHVLILISTQNMVNFCTNKVNICEIANGFVILLILLHGFNEIGFLTLELRY